LIALRLYIVWLSFLGSCGQLTQQQPTQQKLSSNIDLMDTLSINSSNSNLDTITPVNKMKYPRAAHTATLLKSGEVLICGGFGNSTLATAEIYNPVSNSFRSIESMHVARSGHSASLLANGKVLIAGGYNGSYLSSTEIFDPEKEVFSQGPLLQSPRSGHTATILKDGNILLTGGVSTGWSFLESAEIYDTHQGKFVSTGSMSVKRESHTATLLNNGGVLITGGHQGRRPNITIYSNAEIYSPTKKQFSFAGNMLIKRHKHDALLLRNGMVLITGGSDERDSRGAYTRSELYDPAKNAFSSSHNMNLKRYKHYGTSVLLPDGNAIVAGGSSKAELYDSKRNQFMIIPGEMELEMLFSTATLLQNGKVLITGGYDENQKISSGTWLFGQSK
jgi:hypothetical protein